MQYPLVLALACAAGLNLPEGLLAASALTSCSMSMAYFGWKHYPGLPETARDVRAANHDCARKCWRLSCLSVGSVAAKHGFGWLIVIKLAGMAVTVF
jgi:hypothetical protein